MVARSNGMHAYESFPSYIYEWASVNETLKAFRKMLDAREAQLRPLRNNLSDAQVRIGELEQENAALRAALDGKGKATQDREPEGERARKRG